MQNIDEAISYIKWLGQKYREVKEKSYSFYPDFWRSQFVEALVALKDMGLFEEEDAIELYFECILTKKEESN